MNVITSFFFPFPFDGCLIKQSPLRIHLKYVTVGKGSRRRCQLCQTRNQSTTREKTLVPPGKLIFIANLCVSRQPHGHVILWLAGNIGLPCASYTLTEGAIIIPQIRLQYGCSVTVQEEAEVTVKVKVFAYF